MQEIGDALNPSTTRFLSPSTTLRINAVVGQDKLRRRVRWLQLTRLSSPTNRVQYSGGIPVCLVKYIVEVKQREY
jgi:hypothetical protein